MQTKKLYQVREFIGSNYSKQLGRRLRDRASAGRVARLLRKQGRQVFIAPLSVAA